MARARPKAHPRRNHEYLRIPDGITAVSVAVTGSKAGRTSTTVTTPESPVRTGFSLPRPKIIVGNTRCVPTGTTPVVGDFLDSAWAGTADSVQFRWYRNGNPIKGAWKHDNRLTAADEESVITFGVTASKAGYKTRTVFSDPTGWLTNDCRYTSPVALPKIVGGGLVNNRLTVNLGTPEPGTKFTYLWSVGSGIYGTPGSYRPVGTSASYTPRTADVGKTVRVNVYVARAGYPSLQVLPILSVLVGQ